MNDILHWEVEDGAGEVRVRARGEVDISNAEDFSLALMKAMPRGAPLVIDMSAVSYLDSAGINMIYRLKRHAAERDCTLRILVPPDSPIRRVMILSKLDSVVDIFS